MDRINLFSAASECGSLIWYQQSNNANKLLTVRNYLRKCMADIKMEKFSIHESDTHACLLILDFYDSEKEAYVSPLQIVHLFQVKLIFERPFEIHRLVQLVI